MIFFDKLPGPVGRAIINKAYPRIRRDKSALYKVREFFLKSFFRALLVAAIFGISGRL